MKKFLVLALAGLLWLAACATAQTPAPSVTATETTRAYATPDTSLATPEVGAAVVRKIEGVKVVQLYSRPAISSPVSGEVYPGESGKFLGSDSSGRWVLVQIGDRTGWALFQLFDLTIVQ